VGSSGRLRAMAHTRTDDRSYVFRFLAVMVSLGLIYVNCSGRALRRTFDQNLRSIYPGPLRSQARLRFEKPICCVERGTTTNQGGWRAANGALKMTLAAAGPGLRRPTEDINAMSRAVLGCCQARKQSPATCKGHTCSAGADRQKTDEFPDAARNAGRGQRRSGPRRKTAVGQQAGRTQWDRQSDERSSGDDLLGRGRGCRSDVL